MEDRIGTVLRYLTDEGIEFIRHDHPAVFTCEEAERLCGHLPGMPSKNLFLRDERKRRYYLYTLPAEVNADLKAFAAAVGEKRVSFAGSSDLISMLGLEAGSVSPFGLIHDRENRVKYCIDSRVFSADTLSFHPNSNTASLELTGEMFRRYLRGVGNEIVIVEP